MDPDRTFRAVAFALTGQLAEPPGAQPSGRPEDLLAALAALGMDADRLDAIRAGRVGAGQPWPVPVPAELRQGLGPAQLLATIQACREMLGLRQRQARVRDASAPLDPGDRRLLAELPPHHGLVG